jgi:gas vesicle protein
MKYGFAAGTAVGILMGITAGILIAPKSGKETRQAIAEEVESTVKKVTAPVKGKICCHKKQKKLK